MGAGGFGREWGALGYPRVQLKLTVVSPPLVVRLREGLPRRAQTVMQCEEKA